MYAYDAWQLSKAARSPINKPNASIKFRRFDQGHINTRIEANSPSVPVTSGVGEWRCFASLFTWANSNAILASCMIQTKPSGRLQVY